LGLGIGGAALAGVGRGILNGQEVDTVRNFLTMTDKWHQPGIDLRQVGREYPQFASDYVKVRPFGHTPVEVMRGIRSTSLGGDRFAWRDPMPLWRVMDKNTNIENTKAMDTDPAKLEALSNDPNHPYSYRQAKDSITGEIMKDPGSREHYDKFSQGGVPAYLHYLSELNGAFHTGKYNETVAKNPQGVDLTLPQYKDVMKDWGGKVLSNTDKEVDLVPQQVKERPEALSTLRNVVHDTQPKYNPEVPTPEETALAPAPGQLPVHKQIYSKHPIEGSNTFYPADHISGFHNRIADYAERYAVDHLGIHKPLEQLTPQENQAVLAGLDGYLKTHDPAVWRQKQWADMTLGMWGTEASNSYGALGQVGLALRDLGTYLGAPAGILGAGLLGKYIWNKLRRPMEKKAIELAHNGSVRVTGDLIKKLLSTDLHGATRNRVMPHVSGRKISTAWQQEKTAALFPQNKKTKSSLMGGLGVMGLAGLGAYGAIQSLGSNGPTQSAIDNPVTTKSEQDSVAAPPKNLGTFPGTDITKMIPTNPQNSSTDTNNVVANTSGKVLMGDFGVRGLNKILPWIPKVSKVKIPMLPNKALPYVAEATEMTSDPDQYLRNSLNRNSTFWEAKDFTDGPKFSNDPGGASKQLAYAAMKPLNNPMLFGVQGVAANTIGELVQGGRSAYAKGDGNLAKGYNKNIDDAMNWHDNITNEAPTKWNQQAYDWLAHKTQPLAPNEHAYLGSQHKEPVSMAGALVKNIAGDNALSREIRRTVADSILNTQLAGTSLNTNRTDANSIMPLEEGDYGWSADKQVADEASKRLTASLLKNNPQVKNFAQKAIPGGGYRWVNTDTGLQFKDSDDFFTGLSNDRPTLEHVRTLKQLKAELPHQAEGMFDTFGIKRLFDKHMYTPEIAAALQQAGLLDDAKINELRAMGISPVEERN
jgi:uncharacterized protein (UPF0147 family)